MTFSLDTGAVRSVSSVPPALSSAKECMETSGNMIIEVNSMKSATSSNTASGLFWLTAR